MYYQARIGTGSWISLASLGASNLRRSLVICGVDTFEFDVASALALTEDVSFTYNALVSIRRQTTDSTSAATDQWYFRGRVRSVPRSGQGQSEQYHVRIEGPWSWFDKTLYRQSWAEGAGSISKPRAVLFMQANGTRLATGPQMKAIAEVAITSGAPCTVQDITGGITPPYDEQTNITCAQALIKALSYHPHGAVWFDYSTETPVLKYSQRSALTASSISVLGKTGLSIAQRTDLQVPAIAIYYEKQNTVDGASVPETTRDLYPANADPYGADVLSAVFDLRGNVVTTVSQYIKAEQFPSNYNDSAWWLARVPRLKDYTTVTISGGGRLGDTNLANILVEGEKAPWMLQSFAKERIQCDAVCTLLDGSTVLNKQTETITIEVTATGCAIGETTYRALASFDPGEDIPTGIAEALYTEWAQLHFQGSLTITEDEPTGQALPGHRLNLTDGRTEWATMDALVSRATEDIDSGATSIEFGPPSWTDIDARVAFERAARNRQYAQSRALISGTSTTTGIQGSTPTTEIRDGSIDAMAHVQVFQGTADTAKRIILNPDLISPSAVVTGSKEIQPRLMMIPQLDGNGGLTFKQAVVLGAVVSGDATTPALAKDAPDVPSTYTATQSYWGETSAASGGLVAVPSTSAWVAKGRTGHVAGQGTSCLFVDRVYLDNSASTPNLVAVQRKLMIAEDGRILSISAPFDYVVSPTVAV